MSAQCVAECGFSLQKKERKVPFWYVTPYGNTLWSWTRRRRGPADVGALAV